MAGTQPARVIIRLLKLGLAAIKDNVDILDDILASLEEDELTKVKSYFFTNPPGVIQSYPRFDSQFPLYAVVLLADSTEAEWVGEAELDLLGDDDIKVGVVKEQRRSDSIGVYVYALGPDITHYYYQVAKRILQVGMNYLIDNGLDMPRVSGADLMPEQPEKGAALFACRLTVMVSYNDCWPTDDALWAALNGEIEEFVTDPEKVDHYLSDIHFEDADDDQFGGTLTTSEE